jgi:hypothetical protein
MWQGVLKEIKWSVDQGLRRQVKEIMFEVNLLLDAVVQCGNFRMRTGKKNYAEKTRCLENRINIL